MIYNFKNCKCRILDKEIMMIWCLINLKLKVLKWMAIVNIFFYLKHYYKYITSKII